MVGRVLTSHKRPLPWHCLALSALCAHRSAAPTVYFFLALVCRLRSSPMAPPRDTTGSAGAHKHFEPAEKPGRFNQKSTFRDGTTEEGWFYPTPAALKASADVRGARSAQEFFRPSRSDVPTRRQRRGLLPALPVRFELHVRHGAPRVTSRAGALFPCSLGLTCVCDPNRRTTEDSPGRGFRV